MNYLNEQLERLKEDLRAEINTFATNFESFKPPSGTVIHFEDESGLNSKELGIDCIVGEGSNVGIYPRSKKRLAHSENAIEDVHDLFLILNILKEEFGG